MNNKDNTAEAQIYDDYPNTVSNRNELDSALEAGLKSGVSKRTTEEIFEAGIAKAKAAQMTNG